MARARLRAAAWGGATVALLAMLIVAGSRNLYHFDAALVGYTFATLFAAGGVTYRYNMWLQRPPTRMYWRRGWQVFLNPKFVFGNVRQAGKRLIFEFAANRFIFRRGKMRWGAHWLIMWGCLLAAAITFPLVWGWVHFETAPDDIATYETFVFGFPAGRFPVTSFVGFMVFHGLVWASFLVIGGVMIAFHRRMVDHGAAAVQQFAEDILPLLLLFAISATGLMLTASYTWMHGYAYDFLAILHAITVIFTLVWLPFGKFFHVFQRPAQLGVSFYKDAGAMTAQAECRRCAKPYMSAMMQRDLADVEAQLGFAYDMEPASGAEHYQQICPRCRRAMFGLAQGSLWQTHLNARASADDDASNS